MNHYALLTLLAAGTAGFLAARFAKASAPEPLAVPYLHPLPARR